MSINCTSCGGKPVKTGYYFITARDFFGRTNLLGAVGVGMCRQCICKFSARFLRRPVLYVVFAALGVMICVSMIAFISGRGTVMQYVILAFLGLMCLAGMISNIVRAVRIIRDIRDPDGYIRRITPAEIAAIGTRIISSKRVITDNILFSWRNLAGMDDSEDPLTPVEAEQVRQAFILPMRRGLTLITLHRKEPRIPFTNVPDTMDPAVRRLILRAVKN
ncbi:MAG: hypothetical protein IKE62_01665 [Oscillospiraceae bacterium]|nr:hypothetical protein [Oscillospiraceae bacterium]